MRILYLGNSQGFNKAATYYMTPQKLINGFTRLGHNVYMFNDRDYARASNIFGSQKLGRKKMNAKVLEICEIYKPEMIVLGHCINITNETLAEARRISPDVRIMYRNVDPLHAAENVKDINQRVGHVEAIFITTAGDALKQFAHPKTVTSFMPNPVDPALETKRAYDNPDADIDFIFLASFLRDQYDHRKDLVEYLIENQQGRNFLLGGAGINNGRVYGAAYYELLGRSKMGLCMNKTEDYYLYASGRMSQYMGSGVLAFIPEGPKFEDVLGTDSFVSFKTKEELLDKINYFTAHPAERIELARNGTRKIHDYFHVDKVCQYMIERTFGLPLSQDYQWPTTLY